ncbi:hypothetical protein IAD21_02289 [Abditibacteriota bacterium]|nr:hypothetical protein IAD21_02289 [Abditibacteriota bacterium]
MNIEHSELQSNLDASVLIPNTQHTYEAPAIETVLTPESLEREVHYAGFQSGSGVAVA